MSDRSTRVFGPASMPTLDNPVARASPWACKPGAGYWWQDIQDHWLLQNDALTKAHVWFDGQTIKDRYANLWTMSGTVPQVAASGAVPAGAGPFSDANYYSLGTGSDVLDFAGDFAAAFVIEAPASVTRVIFQNGVTGVSGYGVQTEGARRAYFFHYSPAGVAVSTANSAAAGQLSILCVGRAGLSIMVKLNDGVLASAAVAGIVSGVGSPVKLGRYNANGNPWDGKLYEAWFSAVTPSDALFTAQMQRVKTKLGITAW